MSTFWWYQTRYSVLPSPGPTPSCQNQPHHFDQSPSSSCDRSCEENCEQDDDHHDHEEEDDHDLFYSYLQFYFFLLIAFINFHHLHQISSSREKSCEENCEQDDDDEEEDHDPFLFTPPFLPLLIIIFIKSHHLHVTNLVKKIVNKKKKIHDPFYSHLEFYLFALQMDTYFTKNNP